METPMENQLVSQEVLDALNAPPEPRPLTPNVLIWLKSQEYQPAGSPTP
jgi:hypothetical protein